MIREGIHINGLYQHYKGGYYKVIQVARFHDNELPLIVVYHKCDKDGLYKSIREYNGDDEIIIFQPFYRFIDDFKAILPPSRDNAQRFTFIKEL